MKIHRIYLLAIASLCLLGCRRTVIKPISKAKGVVLWNYLDQADSSGHVASVVGPTGTVTGAVNFNNAVRFATGSTPNGGQALSGVDFPPSILNSEAGTVEMWAIFYYDPVAFQHGVYGFVNNGYFTITIPIRFYWHNPNRLYAEVSFGGTRIGTGFDTFDPPLNEPVHLAMVWDRNGIGASGHTLEIYVDGAQVAATNASGWGTTTPGYLRIGTGWDSSYQTDRFAVDNVIVYDRATTDFIGRKIEGTER